jgi:ABC-type nitrate/sulfonate/bicarbonate transport system substrate-binding protein
MLLQFGLHQGDYQVVRVGGMAQRFQDLCQSDTAATLLSSPYDLMAETAGLRVIAPLTPPYQGNVGAARRSWASHNARILTAFIRIYVAAISWLYETANASRACAILQSHVSGMTAELAEASYTRMLDPECGFFRDGCLRPDGVCRVLNLRSRYVKQQRPLTPEKYFDQRYWKPARA